MDLRIETQEFLAEVNEENRLKAQELRANLNQFMREFKLSMWGEDAPPAKVVKTASKIRVETPVETPKTENVKIKIPKVINN